MLHCKTFVCNPYQQNTYVVHKDGKDGCLIVDAGMYTPGEEQTVADYIRQQGLRVEAILITHAHPDHVCGLDWLKQTYPDAKVFRHSAVSDQQSAAGSQPIRCQLSMVNCQLIPTPGHKEDCVCYYLPDEGVLFSGDTLFLGSVGRTDLPGGDYETLIASLRELMKLPADTVVYPGHGETTTIAHEQRYNPFVR